MNDRVRTFRNSRARIQRVSDGVWFAAWTRFLGREEVRLRLKSFVPLVPGTQVAGECYGDGSRVRFSGVVLGQGGQDVAVRTTGSLMFDACEESIRINVEGVEGRLKTEKGFVGVIVGDISPTSFGCLVPQPVTCGGTLEFEVNAPDGTIAGRGLVANCRAEPGEADVFRIGLRDLVMPRLDAARWSRFLQNAAEA